MKDFDRKVAEVKSLIQREGIIYLSELEARLESLSRREKDKVLEVLKRDGNVNVVESDMIEWVEKRPVTQNEVYLAIKATQKLEVSPDCVKAGNDFVKGLTSVGFPYSVGADFLKVALTASESVDTAIFIEPASLCSLESYLKKKLSDVEEKMHDLAELGINAGPEFESLQLKEAEFEKRLDGISKRRFKFFSFSLFFVTKGGNVEELESATSRLVALMRKSRIIVKTAINYQKDSVKSAAPAGTNFLRRRAVITTSDLLANSFPFIKVQPK